MTRTLPCLLALGLAAGLSCSPAAAQSAQTATSSSSAAPASSAPAVLALGEVHDNPDGRLPAAGQTKKRGPGGPRSVERRERDAYFVVVVLVTVLVTVLAGAGFGAGAGAAGAAAMPTPTSIFL